MGEINGIVEGMKARNIQTTTDEQNIKMSNVSRRIID